MKRTEQLSLFEQDEKTYLEKHRELKEILVVKLIDLMMQKFQRDYKDKNDFIHLICIQAIQRQKAVFMRNKISSIEKEIDKYKTELGYYVEINLKK